MATVKDILNFIETIAPKDLAEEWDRVGLNCGRLDRQVRTVLVALDPFDAVCQEAIDKKVDLLLTHHALLWMPNFITDADVQGRNALSLIENNIACINAHTNLDCAPGGVNDILADKLGLAGITIICPRGTTIEGKKWGLLRKGNVTAQPLSQFLQTVKDALGCDGLRYVDAQKPVCHVAVGGGACGSEMQAAIAAGCDTFVTADVKYNQFWEAKHQGINLIDAGHFHTEAPVTQYLAQQLKNAFSDISVILSEKQGDCTKFF